MRLRLAPYLRKPPPIFASGRHFVQLYHWQTSHILERYRKYCSLKQILLGSSQSNKEVSKMSAQKRIKCWFGIHKWLEWKYVSHNSCQQRRNCLYCSSSQTRVAHDWSQCCSCCRSGSCKRCNEYSGPGGRHSEQICSECGSQLDAFMNG
jgi:hypothetical protein